MGKRGRKSEAELSTVAPVAELPQRPEPPKTLDEAGQARWREIVGALPTDYLKPSDYPLLVDLIETEQYVAYYKQVIEDEGHFVESDRGNLTPHPAVLLRDRYMKTAVKLQQSLRLCPSSRADRKTKGLQKGGGKKPWEK